jgi:hypothetical protein
MSAGWKALDTRNSYLSGVDDTALHLTLPDGYSREAVAAFLLV